MFLINPYRFGGAPAVTTTWNPADKAANITLTGGNRTATAAAAGNMIARATTTISGKVHFEVTILANSTFAPTPGVANAAQSLSAFLGSTGGNSTGYFANGDVYRNNGPVASNDPFTTGDVIAVEVDNATGEVWFEKLGGTGRKGPYIQPGTRYAAMGTQASGDSLSLNAGQSPFAITPTSGFGPLP